jgi:hypothetical protein
MSALLSALRAPTLEDLAAVQSEIAALQAVEAIRRG